MNKENLYIMCPRCNKKLARITDNSVVKNLFLWCKSCKKEVEINKEPLSHSK